MQSEKEINLYSLYSFTFATFPIHLILTNFGLQREQMRN
jgi:hypothetical protein